MDADFHHVHHLSLCSSNKDREQGLELSAGDTGDSEADSGQCGVWFEGFTFEGMPHALSATAMPSAANAAAS